MKAWIAMAVSALVLSGCGYVGDPLPPALNIPARITDFRAVQRGDKIVAMFTIPPLTTEGLPVKVGEVDLRAGEIAAGQRFDINAWAASATKTTGDATDVGATTQTIDVRQFAGKDIAVAVRIVHRRGRPSDWSNPVTLHVIEPLQTPTEVAAGNAPRGVQVTWKGDAPPGASFLIFRQGDKDPEPIQVGESKTRPYVDETTQYGVPYRYQVQTKYDLNGANAESEKSDLMATAFSPIDKFPPAAPSGLTAIAGINTIELSWERNIEGDLAFYRVYRSVADGPRQLVGDKVQTPVFSDAKVESGKRYRYSITAVDNADNESQPSPVVEAVAP